MKMYSKNDISWVSIETTNICNMTCSYCPKKLDSMNHKFIGPNIMDREVYINILEGIKDISNLSYVVLTDFNEFFQTPHLTDFFLPELKKRNLNYMITTNGSMPVKNPEYYADHQPKYLTLGVQTITAEQYYSSNRLPEMSWKKYVDSFCKVIDIFNSRCPDTLISIEVASNPSVTRLKRLLGHPSNENLPSKTNQAKNIDAFIELITSKTGIEFSKDYIEGRYQGQDVVAVSKNTNADIVIAFKTFIDMTDYVNNIKLNSKPVCYADSVTFSTNGDIKMCCIDYTDGTAFANVKDQPIDEIMEIYISKVNEMRTKGSPFEVCKSCFGYKNNFDKYFNIRKRVADYLKHYPKIVSLYRKINN